MEKEKRTLMNLLIPVIALTTLSLTTPVLATQDLPLLPTSDLSLTAQDQICRAVEAVNDIEEDYDIYRHIVYSIEADEYNPFVVEFESGFLSCSREAKKGPFTLYMKPGHAICYELELINLNEDKHNVPLDKQVVFHNKKSDTNPQEEIYLKHEDVKGGKYLKCIKNENDGKWAPLLATNS